jgi:RNA polymerase sigma-70 factor, ECF subfamily
MDRDEPAHADELRLVAALRAGDEAAFAALVERLSGSLLRVSLLYVSSRAVGEEVVQETWLAVLRGIDRFEGRSSLKTWIFRILTNIAKTRGEREGRTLPFSALRTDEEEPSVDPERFFDASHPQLPHHWASSPERFPEEQLLAHETLDVVERAIQALPPGQQAVITLRDVEGWSSEEVRNALELSETNQRVLLHRARSKVRRAIESYIESA